MGFVRPKTFFDKLQAGLLEGVFIQSKLDQCLFMKSNTIFLVYVENMILASTNKYVIEYDI